MQPSTKIKLSFLLYKGPSGYFMGRPFFGSPLQMSPAFKTKEEAVAYKNNHELDSFWNEILKFPKTYDSFTFEPQNSVVKPDVFKEEFGLKEVIIGNGYNNVSFCDAVTQTFYGFKTFAKFIGIPDDKIGLNNTLTLKAGIIQGKVSGTCAFIKDDNFIRLTITKDKGATLARSWFDAVNFYLGTLVGHKDYLPNIINLSEDNKKVQKTLGNDLYTAYKNLLDGIYFTTTCSMAERTQKCYPKGYCTYATHENILTRCLEEYVKTNISIKDNILCTRKTESDFSACDPIFKYESRPEFYRYPYPTTSEKIEILPLAKDLIENIAGFLTQ